MRLSTADSIAAIRAHSAGFATATRGHLDARVEHCPDWSVADPVWHLTPVDWSVADMVWRLTRVHGSWRTTEGGRLPEPPSGSGGPPRPPDAELVDGFE